MDWPGLSGDNEDVDAFLRVALGNSSRTSAKGDWRA